jgi:anthranilate synthase component 1
MLSRTLALDHLRAGRAAPLVRRLPADLLTPVGALMRLDPSGAGDAFLFESVERGERIGRYSYVGVEPAPARAVDAAGFRAALREVAARGPDPEVARGLPRFTGGAVFALRWDYVYALEPRLRRGAAAPEAVADLAHYRDVLCFDHLRQEALLVHTLAPSPDYARDPEAAYDAGLRRLDELTRRLDAPLRGVAARAEGEDTRVAGGPPPPRPPGPEVSLDCAAFAAKAARAKEYIAAGDIFQVVLSRRFERRTSASGLAIYRALRMVNPSPYMFYLRAGGRELAGASPEMLLRVEDGEATTHPIAGTRRRGADDAEDARLAAELRADPKERAEHAMLVDLARNDLGRVADGSRAGDGGVRVTRHMEIERFSHVMHLVSEVRARLRPDVDAVDALDACFPAGTVSGAPKVRAMEIIHELEPTPRGPYAGAVGALSFGGALDTAITIRAVEVEGGVARFQAGAGIVADSLPEREAEETREKALATLRAIGRAEAEL